MAARCGGVVRGKREERGEGDKCSMPGSPESKGKKTFHIGMNEGRKAALKEP